MRIIPHNLLQKYEERNIYYEKSEKINWLNENLKSKEIELLEWYHSNPLPLYIEIALMAMADIGIITEEHL